MGLGTEYLRQHLAIHIESLHTDAAEQPELACQAGELYASCQAKSRQAKLHLDSVLATVESEVRAEPAKFGVIKTTENAISTVVTLDTRVKAAQQELAAAERESGEASVLYTAYDHRRAMLKLEGDLYISNYWGGSHVQGQTGQAATAGRLLQEQELEDARTHRHSGSA